MAEKEYIEREAALSVINRLKSPTRSPAQNELIRTAQVGIDRIRAADVAMVRHGRWDDSGRYQFPSGAKAIRCSICGCALSESEYRLFNWNYCPVCGAKMDLEGGNT